MFWKVNLLFGLAVLGAGLSSTTFALNADLLFEGKPIEPIVISHIADEYPCFEPLDLRKYTLKSQKVRIEKRMDHPGKNEFGYSYEYKGQDQTFFAQTIYRVVADLGNHRHLIFNEICGGAGHRSKLLIIERDGYFIKSIGEISGGDKANGGIQNVTYELKNGVGILHGNIILTPRGVFLTALESLDPNHPLLKADTNYGLLEGAQCHEGYLGLEGPWDQPLKPVSLTISKHEKGCRRFEPGSHLQIAYDTILNEFLEKKESLTLDQQGMKDFAKKVIEAYEGSQQLP